MITVGVAALASVLAVASFAAAGQKPDHPTSAKNLAAKQCAAEKKADKIAFKATYGKHAMRRCIKGETAEGSGEMKNAAKQCKAARKDDPDAFTAAWGSGKNAYGKCVSATAKAADRQS